MKSPSRSATAKRVIPRRTAPALSATSLLDSLVMMVDDEPLNIEVTQMFLEELGYRHFVTTSDSTQAVSMVADHRPDIVLLDLMMPDVTGFDILREVRSDNAYQNLPILMLTSTTDSEAMQTAFELGVNDFLAKPIDPTELGLRLQNTLRAKAHRDSLADYSRILEEEVRQRTQKLKSAQQQIVGCLARTAEYRDDDTGEHVLRVGQYAGRLAAELGMDSTYVETLELASQLHDIGKIGIPDRILLKPGRFDAQEFAEMQSHCTIGASIIEGVPRDACPEPGDARPETQSYVSPLLHMATTIAATHHERWDGTGYPNGLSGADIPLEGRIVAVVDVYDALSSNRPYKEPFPHEQCMSFIAEGRGSHFDPVIADTFISAIDTILG